MSFDLSLFLCCLPTLFREYISLFKKTYHELSKFVAEIFYELFSVYKLFSVQKKKKRVIIHGTVQVKLNYVTELMFAKQGSMGNVTIFWTFCAESTSVSRLATSSKFAVSSDPLTLSRFILSFKKEHCNDDEMAEDNECTEAFLYDQLVQLC